MAENEHKPSWWQTAPGLMTAVAAMIAAITGLITGLNQAGLLDRARPEPVAQAPRPVSRQEESGAVPQTLPPTPTAERPAPSPGTRRSSEPKGSRAAAPRAPAASALADTAPARAADSAAAPVVDTAHVADTTSRQAPPAEAAPDTAPAESSPAPAETPAGRIPAGTTIELAAATRVCSTSSAPGDQFAATVVAPVTGIGGAAIPVGATATLEVQRLEAPTFIGIVGDSLTLEGRSYGVRGATAKVHEREFTAGAGRTGVGVGACIPTGGRITLTLRSPLVLGPAR